MGKPILLRQSEYIWRKFCMSRGRVVSIILCGFLWIMPSPVWVLKVIKKKKDEELTFPTLWPGAQDRSHNYCYLLTEMVHAVWGWGSCSQWDSHDSLLLPSALKITGENDIYALWQPHPEHDTSGLLSFHLFFLLSVVHKCEALKGLQNYQQDSFSVFQIAK